MTSTMLDTKRDATNSIQPGGLPTGGSSRRGAGAAAAECRRSRGAPSGFLVVALALGLGACGWSEETVQSNGEEGVLYLRHAADSEGPCGSATMDPPCGDKLACTGFEDLYVGTHDFQVVRWLRVKSSNGLGDIGTVSEYQELGPADQIMAAVSPADAAAVEVARTCTDAVRLTLTIHKPSAFELVVATEQYSDRWTIKPSPECRVCP